MFVNDQYIVIFFPSLHGRNMDTKNYSINPPNHLDILRHSFITSFKIRFWLAAANQNALSASMQIYTLKLVIVEKYESNRTSKEAITIPDCLKIQKSQFKNKWIPYKTFHTHKQTTHTYYIISKCFTKGLAYLMPTIFIAYKTTITL